MRLHLGAVLALQNFVSLCEALFYVAFTVYSRITDVVAVIEHLRGAVFHCTLEIGCMLFDLVLDFEELERILRDERRHIGFGENEIGRRLREDPRRRVWLSTVRSELDRLVLETLERAQDELQIARSERPALGRDYLQAVDRLGIGS